MRHVIAGGIRLRSLDGTHVDATPPFTTDPEVVADADLVLITVKSGANAEVAATLHHILGTDAVVVSVQNGLRGASELRERLPHHRVLAAMVGFNVVREGASLHQTTAGDLMVEADPAWAPYAEAFARGGVAIEQRTDMAAVQRAKLLLNLNNAVNALSRLPLKEQLSHRDFRRSLSLAQREALRVMAADGPAPAKLTDLPPAVMARALNVPDVVFRVLGPKALAIDPAARSSMADDLDAGRATEVDWINGAVVELAEQARMPAPVNARLVALVHDAERGVHPQWSAADLLGELRRAAAG